MIAANEWYNISQTDTIGSKTGIKIEIGDYYAMFIVMVDFGSAMITAIKNNIPDIITIGARIRYSEKMWYVDISVSPSQNTSLNTSLYDNNGWQSVPANSTIGKGDVICVINDITTQVSPTESTPLWEVINIGTEEDPIYAIYPKNINNKIVNIASRGEVTANNIKVTEQARLIENLISNLNNTTALVTVLQERIAELEDLGFKMGTLDDGSKVVITPHNFVSEGEVTAAGEEVNEEFKQRIVILPESEYEQLLEEGNINNSKIYYVY